MASYPIPSWLQRYGDPAQIYLESKRQSDTLEMEKQRLAQQQEQAAIETQTRQEIAAQRAREQAQQLEIDRARITAEAGLRSRQIDIQQSRLNQTATAAAQRFAASQQLAQRIAGGENPATAALQVPGLGLPGAGIASLARQSIPKAATAPIEDQLRTVTLPSGEQVNFIQNPKSGALYRLKANVPEGMTKAQRDSKTIEVLRDQRRVAEKAIKPLAEKYANMSEAELKAAAKKNDVTVEVLKERGASARAARAKVHDIDQQLNAILRGESPTTRTGTAKPSQKVKRANELAQAHPDWTKAQIIKAVNDEGTGTAPEDTEH